MKRTITKECILTIGHPDCVINRVDDVCDKLAIWAHFGKDEEELLSTLDVKPFITKCGFKLFRLHTPSLTSEEKNRILDGGAFIVNEIDIVHVTETCEYDDAYEHTEIKEYDQIILTDVYVK